jgi:hypothetical protein
MTGMLDPDISVKRARLAELLTEAAEIEHDVMCQYLFAAFSMKKSVDEGCVNLLQLETMRGWQATLTSIARQEMEHLGIVCNLLTAIGETPYMWRANYPVSSRHYPVAFQSDLRPFSLEALAQFIRIEMPPLADDDKRFLQEKEIPIARKDGVDAAGEFNSIAALYLEIERLFEDLDAVGSLFIGPPSAQIGLSSILPFSGFLRGISVPANARMYDIELLPVCDLKSAKASIRQVLDEGEGGGAILEPQSHFGRFVAMYIAFRDELARCPQFAPARPVVTNPKTAPVATHNGRVTVITDPATRRVSELFDAAYGAMLLLLIRFLANTDSTAAEIATLQGAAFFPLMTTIVRPVAELLTQLSAHPKSRETAGPSFDIPRRIQFLPHRKAAWQVMLRDLQHLAALAKSLAKDDAYSAATRARLQLVFENAQRISDNFEKGMNMKTSK